MLCYAKIRHHHHHDSSLSNLLIQRSPPHSCVSPAKVWGSNLQRLLTRLGTSKNVSLGSGLTLETIPTLVAAGQTTAGALEFVHADGGESRGGVVLGLVVVDFVDGDGGVDDVRFNRLLLHNRLDGLVDVVVDVFTGDDGLHGSSVLAFHADGLVAEFGGLGGEVVLVLLVVIVLDLAVLDGDDLVVVGLGELLGVVDGLDRGVIVVLVDFLVDGGGDVLVLGLVDGFVGHGGSDGLVDGGVVVTGLVQEGLDLFLGGVHVYLFGSVVCGYICG